MKGKDIVESGVTVNGWYFPMVLGVVFFLIVVVKVLAEEYSLGLSIEVSFRIYGNIYLVAIYLFIFYSV